MAKYGLAMPAVGGMEIYEEPLPPAKLQLSKKLDLDPVFRAEYDLWLLARFGRQPSMLDNKFLVSERYGFFVAPHGTRQAVMETMV